MESGPNNKADVQLAYDFFRILWAPQLHHTIVAATEDLSLMPYGFRQGRLSGTREMVVHPNYVVVYQVTDCVEVIDVLHTSQQYPKP